MKLIHFFVLIFLSNFVLSQTNSGFVGKKTMLEFNALGNYTFFPNLIQGKSINRPDLKYIDGQFIKKLDWFDGGFELGIQRTLSRHFGLSLYVGMDFFNVGYNNYTIHHENISVRGTYFIPTIEFTNKAGMLPMGIVHQLGIAFRTDHPIDKNYAYEKISNPNLPIADSLQLLNYNFNNPDLKSWAFNYSVRMRHPIGDNLFLNYGLRYTLSFFQAYDKYSINDEGYEISEAEMRNSIRGRRVTSFIKLNVGVSYVF